MAYAVFAIIDEAQRAIRHMTSDPKKMEYETWALNNLLLMLNYYLFAYLIDINDSFIISGYVWIYTTQLNSIEIFRVINNFTIFNQAKIMPCPISSFSDWWHWMMHQTFSQS